ncbi:uncharacterized protein A4U43_C05F18960 [Asparagus officinalis]|uniref:Uncharacterized protein n=1 Tax=Asparagus officinalis TaxID=4686 RepID=A0A5P1EWK4_ASPOF|nr:uncharacterized protein A4U43_C05F18960 [Asparagus officinalis]
METLSGQYLDKTCSRRHPVRPVGKGPLITQLNHLENVGLIDESSHRRQTAAPVVDEDAVGPSTNPEASHCPGKEPIGVNNIVEGRGGTSSEQIENGADGRILEDIPSVAYSKLSKLV